MLSACGTLFCVYCVLLRSRQSGRSINKQRVTNNGYGAVIDVASNDPLVQGVRRFHELVAAESRVSATAIQTVGSKGYDGFTLMIVTE